MLSRSQPRLGVCLRASSAQLRSHICAVSCADFQSHAQSNRRPDSPPNCDTNSCAFCHTHARANGKAKFESKCNSHYSSHVLPHSNTHVGPFHHTDAQPDVISHRDPYVRPHTVANTRAHCVPHTHVSLWSRRSRLPSARCGVGLFRLARARRVPCSLQPLYCVSDGSSHCHTHPEPNRVAIRDSDPYAHCRTHCVAHRVSYGDTHGNAYHWTHSGTHEYTYSFANPRTLAVADGVSDGPPYELPYTGVQTRWRGACRSSGMS